MRKNLFCLLTLLPLLSTAQIPVGSWRAHLSYRNVTEVVETPEMVYAVATKDFSTGAGSDGEPLGTYTANNGALFAYDKQSESVETFTRSKQLSDVLVRRIAYSSKHQLLVIAYENGNIDLLKGDQVYNLSELKDKSLSYDKTINSISIEGDTAYLATNFGYASINLRKREFIESLYFKGGTDPCFQLLKGAAAFLMFNQSGVYRCPLDKNTLDQANWTQVCNVPFKQALRLENQIVACGLQGMYSSSDKDHLSWTKFSDNGAERAIVLNSQRWAVLANQFLLVFDTSLLPREVLWKSFDHKIFGAACANGGELWLGMGPLGLSGYTMNQEATQYDLMAEMIMPDGPKRNECFYLSNSGEKIMATAGGGFWNNNRLPGTFYVFDNEHWSSYDLEDPSLIDPGVTTPNRVDFTAVIEDPIEKERYWVATWGDCIYEFKQGRVVQRYSSENNPALIGGRVNSFVLDSDKQLWTASANGDGVAFCRFQEGRWVKEYQYAIREPWTYSLQFAKNTNLWGVFRTVNQQTAGFFVYSNDNKTLTRYQRIVDQDGSSFTAVVYFGMAYDKKDNLWIGTSNGPIQVTNASSSDLTKVRFIRPKVARNDGTNLADYLLSGVSTTCVAIDGANRKWFGTEKDGVYVVNESGTEILANYTTRNSPILSNMVNSLAIHPRTGEVFIGTDNGICSFRSGATEPQKNFKQVAVFPNPVRPGYEGLITIDGLRENTVVRITDLSGNLIHKGQSLGGQYSWNGLNINGRRLATGTYLVYGATSDGEDGIVAKFLVVQ